MKNPRVLELDIAASLFFTVAASLVFVSGDVVPWLELYQEQTVSGEEMVLLVEEYGGNQARSATMGGGLALLAVVLVYFKRHLWSFWVAVCAFFSGVMTYALLHSSLTEELAPERKQALEPGWGISSFLLWMAVGIFLFFMHLWGESVWSRLKQGIEPVDAAAKEEASVDPVPVQRATWVVALVLLVLMVLFVASADPSDKVWKKMMR